MSVAVSVKIVLAIMAHLKLVELHYAMHIETILINEFNGRELDSISIHEVFEALEKNGINNE